jgi:hypothetical protein
VGLLSRLGKVCDENPVYFGTTNPRPGNLLDFLLAHDSTITTDDKYSVDIDVLWEVIMKGFAGIWPESRTNVEGVSVGDAWPCDAIKGLEGAEDTHGLVVFHKLSQWLTYSLMVSPSIL